MSEGIFGSICPNLTSWYENNPNNSLLHNCVIKKGKRLQYDTQFDKFYPLIMNQIDKDVPTKNPIPDVSDSKSCANYCLSNPNCNLYEYDMRNKQCTLFRDGEIKIGGKTQKEAIEKFK